MTEPYRIGYARTSTRQQDLGIQRDALLKAGVPSAEIFEEQESGAKQDRPVLANVLSRLRRGDTLVCWRFDRVARTASQLMTIVDDLKARGVSFISITEDFNSTTPMGKAMLGIAAVFAEMEREGIEERREAGLRRAREKGVKFGRKSAADPNATRRDADGSRVTDDKSGRLAKAMMAVGAGQSIRSAAKEHRIGQATLHRHLNANSERINGADNSERITEREPYRNGHLNGSSATLSAMT